MTPERYRKICDTLDRRQPDLTVITDNVHKPHNVSAILRTCDAVGIAKAHIAMPEDPDFRIRSGIAMGSDRWVDHQMYSTVNDAISALKSAGHKVYAAHFSDTAVDYRTIDYTGPVALLLGTEKFGVSEEAVDASDGHVVIPMMGMVESFNVSVAAAIILNEAQNQRQKAGLYDRRRLPDEEYQRFLFRWCQPILTRYCDENDIPYPNLDDEGEVIDGPQWIEKIREAKSSGV